MQRYEDLCIPKIRSKWDGYVAVDLGLPSGVKWATINLGATEPGEIGDFYAWAAIVPWLEEYHINPSTKSKSECSACKWNDEHKSYDFTNCPYNISGSANTPLKAFTKYTGDYVNAMADGADPEDLAKTVLDPEDDAATYQWGDGWRIPTAEEIKELKDYTYWMWTDNYNNTGYTGYIVYKCKSDEHRGTIVYANGTGTGVDYSGEYSITDTHIFFRYYGTYWSSTVHIQIGSYDARGLSIDKTWVDPYYAGYNRCYPFLIRPVKD